MTATTGVPFGRVLTAIITPMTPEGELDLDGLSSLAERLVAQGNDGLVVNGTTGEAPTTSRAEKSAAVRAVVDAVGDRAHVLAGVGTNDTAHSVELARDAAKAGATGLLAVTPYYSRPPAAGVIAHTERIADSTDLPVMLYDIPVRTGLALSNEVLLQLARHPRIVAVKDAKDDLGATSWLVSQVPASELAVYSGADELNLPLLAIGGVGIVSVVSHLASVELRQLIESYLAGDVDRARDINLRLQPAYKGFFRTQGVILTKAALRLLGLPAGPVRLPLVDATDEQVAVLTQDLTAAGLLTA
ncbi:MAG: 4-hydroxy-tetrahydrodipicolinate synthase [Frankiales bacterium]|nr:4-hydroxy-tetrahydrodipicolinate synthase [Frankiales bacterium]